MLKDKGYKVAATYAGNDTAARQFQAETGIPIYKFDVADFAACIMIIEAELNAAAAVADGMHGVDAQIHDDLVDLAGIGLDKRLEEAGGHARSESGHHSTMPLTGPANVPTTSQ